MIAPSAIAEIHVLNKRVRLAHLAQGGFRTSLDSVMVAAACPIKSGQSLLDMGCGVGGAGLCVAARVPDIGLTGVEILPQQAELAQHNASLNNVQADIVCADIRDFAASLKKPVFDHVLCNPPYLETGTYSITPDELRASAMGHVDEDISITDWVRAAHRCVKSKGSITFIYRADGLDRLLAAMEKFGAVEVIPLWPRAAEAAKRVIVRAIKDRRGGFTLNAGIVLHDGEGYSPQADAILREMAAI